MSVIKVITVIKVIAMSVKKMKILDYFMFAHGKECD